MHFSSILHFRNGRLLMLMTPSQKRISSVLCFSPKVFQTLLQWMFILPVIRSIIQIFLISYSGKILYFVKVNSIIFDPLLEKSYWLFCSTSKRWKNRKSSGIYLLYDIIFYLEPMAPLLFSTAAIVDVFFGIDLIIVLDFTAFLTDSSVCLATSINRKTEEKDKFIL